MEALASRRAPTQEEVSAKVLTELADILEENRPTWDDIPVSWRELGERFTASWEHRKMILALRDGAAALNLEVIRENQPLTLHTPIKYEGEYVA